MSIDPDLDEAQIPFKDDDLLFVNGRSALFCLLNALRPQTVWVPSYLCEAVLHPIRQCEVRLQFFDVDASLNVSSVDWLADVSQGDFVILIDYFGFPVDETLLEQAKATGAWIVEDACQAMFTEDASIDADFVIYSPRKFVGVPDGGILSVRTNRPEARALREIRLMQADDGWWLQAFTAVYQRNRFDDSGTGREWYKLFRDSEAQAPTGLYSMSDLSRCLLKRAFNFERIRQTRRANYQMLLDHLSDWALFDTLPASVVPLGFPIRVARRELLLKQLHQQEIFPPIHWPLEGVAPARFVNSHALSREILTLPCDQRYGEANMVRMASLIRHELRR